MMDWDKLRVFHAVADAGSFTHAGDALNLSQSAVSRQISALEDSLGVSLFHRHARGLVLTEPGEHLHQAVRHVVTRLAATEALLAESKDVPKGPLKVTATMAFGSTWLTPRIPEFLELYPDVELTLLLDDSELDLSMREADVAIRVNTPRQPDLIQRHLMTIHSHLYAHQSYVNRRGVPRTRAELAGHDLISYPLGMRPPFANVQWILDAVEGPPRPGQPALQVNSVYAIYRAVECGMGIAALPDFLMQDARDFVRVLPEVGGPKVEAYFVYAEELRHSKRIAVFREFLLRKVAESRF